MSFITEAHYIISLLRPTNTRTHTHTHTHKSGRQTHIHRLHKNKTSRHRTTHASEILGPVSTTTKLTWNCCGWRHPRTAKRTHERTGGFCVCGVSHFITWETQDRPSKSFEALGGVYGNRLCGYLQRQLQLGDCKIFPGLGLRLSGVGRGNRPGVVYHSADMLIIAYRHGNFQINKSC